MRDDEMIGLFFERNEDAVAEAKKKYEKYCRYIASNILHDAGSADECFNDVLLAAWNSIPPQRPSNLGTYLGKLTREIAVDHLRKKCAKKRYLESAPSLDELEEIIGGCDVESKICEEELSRLVSHFLRSLGEDERNIFIRRYWYYDPVKAICARYGFGQSKVLVTLKRTRDKLALYLKKEGYLL